MIPIKMDFISHGQSLEIKIYIINQNPRLLFYVTTRYYMLLQSDQVFIRYLVNTVFVVCTHHCRHTLIKKIQRDSCTGMIQWCWYSFVHMDPILH